MQTDWGLTAAGWLAGVIAAVIQLHIINGEETQGSAASTFTVNWTQHLGDNMNPSIRVKKPGIVDVPVQNIKIKNAFCSSIKTFNGAVSYDGN